MILVRLLQVQYMDAWKMPPLQDFNNAFNFEMSCFPQSDFNVVMTAR